MANAEQEIAGNVQSLIDVGASAEFESGVARRLYAPARSVVGSNGNVLQPTAGGALPASANGVSSTLSTSDTPLGSAATFTPSGGASSGYDDMAALGWPSAIEVSIATDIISNSSSQPAIQVQWSRDGTNIDLVDGALVSTDTPFGGITTGLGTVAGITVPTGLRKTFLFAAREFQYVRVAYFNSGGAQSVFHLRTVYRYNPTERGCTYRYAPGYGSWEAMPTNAVVTMISNTTRAGNVTATTGKRVNLMHIGAMLALNVTAVPVTPAGLDVILEISYDNGNTFIRVNQSLAGAYITATGLYNFIWHPNANNLSTGISASTAKQMVGFPLPLVWQARVVPQDNNAGVNYTYSMQVALITQ